MTQHFEAIIENGRLCPIEPIAFAEGERVSVTVESRPQISSTKMLELAGAVYDGLSESDIAEVERVAFDRNDWFLRGNNQ